MYRDAISLTFSPHSCRGDTGSHQRRRMIEDAAIGVSWSYDCPSGTVLTEIRWAIAPAAASTDSGTSDTGLLSGVAFRCGLTLAGLPPALPPATPSNPIATFTASDSSGSGQQQQEVVALQCPPGQFLTSLYGRYVPAQRAALRSPITMLAASLL